MRRPRGTSPTTFESGRRIPGAKPEICQRICPVGVEASRYEQPARGELLREGDDKLVEGEAVGVARRPGGKGQVNRRPLPGPLPSR